MGDVLQQGALVNGTSVLDELSIGEYSVSVTSEAGCGNLQQSFSIGAPAAMKQRRKCYLQRAALPRIVL